MIEGRGIPRAGGPQSGAALEPGALYLQFREPKLVREPTPLVREPTPLVREPTSAGRSVLHSLDS